MDSADYYNAIADSYEALYRQEQLSKLMKILPYVNPKQSDTVLDVGAGSGILEEQLKVSSIVAVEPSNLADILISKKIPNVAVEKSRFEDFRTDRKFDIVFALTVLQDMGADERILAVNKMFEMCKEGGKVVISVLKKSGLDYSTLGPQAKGEAENDVFFVFVKQSRDKKL
jgi:2-polyprenyl-3-methyl-5-hydroxy-6-metoxy-1,4-benzoquinol methylase